MVDILRSDEPKVTERKTIWQPPSFAGTSQDSISTYNMLVAPVVDVVDFPGMVTDYADRIAGALDLRDVEDLRSMGPGTVEGMLIARNVQILPLIQH